MQRIEPNEAKKQWMDLKYGMFIHFGLTTFEGNNECGSGCFGTENFNPTELDIAGWSKLAKDSGMKYAVLTAKHVDGFCLWPSKYTSYSVKNTPQQIDIVGEFVKEFRKQGIKVGLYYALWDRRFPAYQDNKIYAKYVRNQIEELLTSYGDIIELWFDGGWDKEHPTKEWIYDSNWEHDPDSGLKHGEVWEWNELYELVHRLQPDCLVANNPSSDRPGGVKYFPLDLRNAERVEYILDNHICKAITNPVFVDEKGVEQYLPLEYANTLTPNWFFREGQHVLHPTVATICGWYRTAVDNHANLLLNVGPDKRGKMPEYHYEYLLEAAKELGLTEGK